MTGSNQEPEQWKPVKDGPGYEVSWDGNFRSVDRVTPSGRRCKGQPIATTTNNDGYVLIKYRDADGKRVTRSAHRVMLEAFAGRCPDGEEARHYDDNPAHNVWRPGTEEESRARGGNLFWGTWVQNRVIDRKRNNPAAAKPARPAKECARCRDPFEGNGRRCHPCVVTIGRSAADMLVAGQTLPDVAKSLDYPSTEGIHALAVKYGGYGARKSWWKRTVKPRIVTVRNRRAGRGRSRTVTDRASANRPGGKDAPEGRKSVGAFPSKPGHSGTFESRNVTERSSPDLAGRSNVAYPADLIQRDRPSRVRGGSARRSR